MRLCQQLGHMVAGALDIVIAHGRKKAYNSRVLKVIDGEEKNINRAYIALGKHYYKNMRTNTQDEAAEMLCQAVDRSRSREQAARRLLQVTVESKNRAGSIAIIGGADGPTAIWVSHKKK